MNRSEKPAALVWWLAFSIFAAADAIAKIFISRSFRNYGFVFSIPLPAWLIYLVYGFVLVPLIFYFFKHLISFTRWEITGWILIFGGSTSNILERIRLGYVRDFIYIPGGSVINIADILITAGLIILLTSRNKK